MKIAVSAVDKKIENQVADVFGRCPYFIISEIKDGKLGEVKAIKNENDNQNSSAGISTAQLIVEKEVNVVITKNIGPRALDVLKQFKVEVYFGEGSIKDVFQMFLDKKLKKIN